MNIPQKQRRFDDAVATHGRRKSGAISPDHPRIKAGGTVFPTRVYDPVEYEYKLLKSGYNSRKIGKVIAKGQWKNMPIYTLTLEERRTCPESCVVWGKCYGNNMDKAHRFKHGADFEGILEHELGELNEAHPEGFAVRLHVLGDFYSRIYLVRWLDWLDQFEHLHIFGFTAHAPDSEIGRIIKLSQQRIWQNCAIRFSGNSDDCGSVVVADKASVPEGVVLCPFDSHKTKCCATCGLCWNSKKPIAFLEH